MGHPLNGAWTMDDAPYEIRHGYDVKRSLDRDRRTAAWRAGPARRSGGGTWTR